jgi:phenylacetate-coenzyme A ligase PaaK-like adenylate-forming protein
MERDMMIDFKSYMENYDKCVGKYIPPKDTWTPIDEAIYKPLDLYRIPLKDANQMQFKSIKYAFNYHYKNNEFYNNFCKEHNVSPDDIKTNDDFKKIPLIPDKFFKDYPKGKDFATWVANVYTGELPEIVINKSKPTYDEVIDAFNKAGIIIAFSSGTSGKHTFIPRNQRTFNTCEYVAAKSLVNMIYPLWEYDAYGYLLMPNPKKTNVYAGKVLEIYFDAAKDLSVAIDREVTTELIRLTMGGKGVKAKIAQLLAKRSSVKMIDDIIKWLQDREKNNDKFTMVGAPYILFAVMKKLKREGISFNFGEKAGIATGGGWKVQEHNRIPFHAFQKEVEDVLGIPDKYCLDIYGMVEGNGWMVHCPEGHYLHSPYSYYKPLVLDEEFNQVDYGESGRFAFLDSAAMSYPGFVVTGDQVKLLERCPICNRPGPVLEPEIKRVKGEEIRGCAEEVRRMLSSDIGK